MTPAELLEQAEFLGGSIVEDVVARGTAGDAVHLDVGDHGAPGFAETTVDPTPRSIASVDCCPRSRA